MEIVGRLGRLWWLNLDGSGITDVGMSHLANLSDLKNFSLENASITG